MDWLTPENWNALVALLGIIGQKLNLLFTAVLVLGLSSIGILCYLGYKMGQIEKRLLQTYQGKK